MKVFPGKLLLFGEYTVLLGGRALAIPIPEYAGHWAFGTARVKQPLRPFFNFLKHRQKQGLLAAQLNLSRFEEELEGGLYFDSSIPVGYGLGSSGALCAAVYDRYALERIAPEDEERQNELRQQLAQMEGFFHGSSSGADPLICYLQQPLLLEHGKANRVSPLMPTTPTHSFFLLDTQRPRHTAPLVDRFHAYCEQPAFRQMAEQLWMPLSERATQQYVQGKRTALAVTMDTLSSVQLEHLQSWIPEAVRPFWREGLKSRQYSMKLCGAGGGGFLLGYGKTSMVSQLAVEHPVIALDKT
ncbi:MAG TPA: hypothetical protein VJ933_02280 [Phaeodactylibacter sp.]|nr:hypothetical protein [Phaeodactylibacter sp.]